MVRTMVDLPEPLDQAFREKLKLYWKLRRGPIKEAVAEAAVLWLKANAKKHVTANIVAEFMESVTQ